MSSPIIVTDAGPLIALAKLDQLSLLSALFSQRKVDRDPCRTPQISALIKASGDDYTVGNLTV